MLLFLHGHTFEEEVINGFAAVVASALPVMHDQSPCPNGTVALCSPFHYPLSGLYSKSVVQPSNSPALRSGLPRDFDANMDVEILDVNDEEARALVLSIDPLAELEVNQEQLQMRLMEQTPTVSPNPFGHAGSRPSLGTTWVA
jgi:hypothetical protein